VTEYDDELKQMYEEGPDDRLDTGTFRIALRELSLKPAVLVSPQTSVKDAVAAMRDAHQGCVLACERGDLVGIFTERDALLGVLAEGLHPAETTIGSVMTRAPEALNCFQTLRCAIHLMVTGGFRHVPVVDGDGRPIGVVSAREVLSYLAELFPQHLQNLPPQPSDFMSRFGG
jgi:CBS domain-containing protein